MHYNNTVNINDNKHNNHNKRQNGNYPSSWRIVFGEDESKEQEWCGKEETHGTDDGICIAVLDSQLGRQQVAERHPRESGQASHDAELEADPKNNGWALRSFRWTTT